MRDRLVELYKEATTLYFDYLDSIDEQGLTDTEGRAKFTIDHLIANGVIVPPCKVGDEIWVVEEDDITCYMFLAKSKGCIIATSWINDYDVDETIEYHIEETQENMDTDLVVFPEEYCFATKDQAEQKLKELSGNG
jgi:hypothetical protein